MEEDHLSSARAGVVVVCEGWREDDDGPWKGPPSSQVSETQSGSGSRRISWPHPESQRDLDHACGTVARLPDHLEWKKDHSASLMGPYFRSFFFLLAAPCSSAGF